MEDGEHAFLQDGLKVYQHIAAADEIQTPEGRIRKHVVRRKDYHPPDNLGYLILIVALAEVFAQALRRYVVDDAFRKDALARGFNGLGVHIRGKDLDVAGKGFFFQYFVKQDADGIGLLAGGAAGAPDADGVRIPGALDNAPYGLELELFK